MVCHSHQEAVRVHQKASEMGYNIPFPLTFTEFRQGGIFHVNIKHFLIDNADYLLAEMSRVPIDTIVVFKEREEI
jgi:hypothetical protein